MLEQLKPSSFNLVARDDKFYKIDQEHIETYLKVLLGDNVPLDIDVREQEEEEESEEMFELASEMAAAYTNQDGSNL